MKYTIQNEFIIIAVLSLVLIGLIAAGIQGVPAPLPLLRLGLGLFFVLIAPGYTLQAALFPRRDTLDGPERLALSFGLSVVIVPPIALILDRLPWGIRLWPIVASEVVFMSLCFAVAWYRRRRLPDDERFIPAIDVDLKGWWAAQTRTSRRLFGLLGLSLLLAAIGATAIIVTPNPYDYFTEFYILGAEGQAEDYPREAVVEEPVTVTLGIVNRERQPAQYRVEVHNSDHLVGQTEPMSLGRQESVERKITFTSTTVGDDVKIQFLLYRDGDAEPYRELYLWLNVVPVQGFQD